MAFGDHIQSRGVDSGTVTSASLAYVSNNTAGNELSLVARAGTGLVNQISSVTDSQGNSWSRRASIAGVPDPDIEIWTAENCAAGANTVTVNLLLSLSLRWIIQEHEGTMTFEAANSATSSGTALDSGSVTVAGNALLLGGNCVSGSTSFNPTGSFTERQQIVSKVQSQDRVVTAGTYNSTCTIDVSGVWGAAVVALKAADSGSGAAESSGSATVQSAGASIAAASASSDGQTIGQAAGAAIAAAELFSEGVASAEAVGEEAQANIAAGAALSEGVASAEAEGAADAAGAALSEGEATAQAQGEEVGGEETIISLGARNPWLIERQRRELEEDEAEIMELARMATQHIARDYMNPLRG